MPGGKRSEERLTKSVSLASPVAFYTHALAFVAHLLSRARKQATAALLLATDTANRLSRARKQACRNFPAHHIGLSYTHTLAFVAHLLSRARKQACRNFPAHHIGLSYTHTLAVASPLLSRARKQASSLATAAVLLLASGSTPAAAAVKRVVIVKIDGLPGWYVERALSERDPATGKSRAPWFDHIFAQRGARLANFYTRGLSLSVPSWSILDTGQHLQIHGNVEYDRYTMKVYDYMNFFAFIVDYSRGNVADTPGVEVLDEALDEAGTPLFSDLFPWRNAYRNSQLFERGGRVKMLQLALQNKFQPAKARQLIDEWQSGFNLSGNVYLEMERAMTERLKDPKIEYLDVFTGHFDHQSHLTMDRFTHQRAYDEIDASLGRVWSAIQSSPLADETVLVAVSDHGMNTVEGIYSQAYDLVSFFNSAAGGGHHVVTNRVVMQEFKLRGLDPFVFRFVTPSPESYYLQGQSDRYPTVLLDLDGNERSSVHLRNNQLNRLHMLIEAIPTAKSRARQYADMAIEIINSQRPRWEKALAELKAEIAAIEHKRDAATKEKIRPLWKYTKDEIEGGFLLGQMRNNARMVFWSNQAREYEAYSKTLARLLSVTRDELYTGKYKVQELIAPNAMGEPNTVADLRDYAVALTSDGFRTVNYLKLLTGLRTKNNVQLGVAPHPVDFIALRLPEEDNAILLYAAEDRMVKIRRRADGRIQYDAVTGWRDELPLRLFEDAELKLPDGVDRLDWLRQWHTEREWLNAVHKTKYSNGIIGLTEQFSPVNGKQRELVQADMLLLANDHWNFNVRSFNPGGNHGSFFRISTHSVLAFWGGDQTGIPRGLVVNEPYDSLSLAPTLAKLLGRDDFHSPGEPIDLKLSH